jgi:hypothetical protein
VSTPEVVAHIPDREVQGMIFVLAGCDGNGRFVAPKDYGNKKSAMGIWVVRNSQGSATFFPWVMGGTRVTKSHGSWTIRHRTTGRTTHDPWRTPFPGSMDRTIVLGAYPVPMTHGSYDSTHSYLVPIAHGSYDG